MVMAVEDDLLLIRCNASTERITLEHHYRHLDEAVPIDASQF